jgi:hypothetical protein
MTGHLLSWLDGALVWVVALVLADRFARWQRGRRK